jgi:hypothetical protein
MFRLVLCITIVSGFASAISLWNAICHAGLDVETFLLTVVVEAPLFAIATSWTDIDSHRALGVAFLFQPSYREIVILDSVLLNFDPWLLKTGLHLKASASRRSDRIDICISNYLFCYADIPLQKLVCEPYAMPALRSGG